MPFVVDTVQVAAQDLASYLDAIEHRGVPVMTEAGATFVSCATTSADHGREVDVQVVWSFADHDHWNVIRKNLVLDRRWYEYAGEIAALRTGGTRRFLYPAAFS